MKGHQTSMYCAWCKLVNESQIATAKDNLAADPSSRILASEVQFGNERVTLVTILVSGKSTEFWAVQKAKCSIGQQLNVVTFLYHTECNILMPTHGMQAHWVVACGLTLILLLLWKNLGQTVTVRRGKQPVAREAVDSETQSDYEHS